MSPLSEILLLFRKDRRNEMSKQSTYLCISMTSLLAHTVAQSTKWRFLPKNLNHLVIFVIGIAFTWSWVDKNRDQFQKTNYVLQKIKVSKNGFIISCSPNIIILTETKIKLIKLTFDIENWLWKSNFGDFC